MAKRLAEDMKADFLIIQCTLGEEMVKQRLAKRLEEGSTSDGRWEIFEQQKGQFEPVVEVPPRYHVIIDTSVPINNSIKPILDKID